MKKPRWWIVIKISLDPDIYPSIETGAEHLSFPLGGELPDDEAFDAEITDGYRSFIAVLIPLSHDDNDIFYGVLR